MGGVVAAAEKTSGGIEQFGSYAGIAVPIDPLDLIAEYPGMSGSDAAVFVLFQADLGHGFTFKASAIVRRSGRSMASAWERKSALTATRRVLSRSRSMTAEPETGSSPSLRLRGQQSTLRSFPSV